MRAQVAPLAGVASPPGLLVSPDPTLSDCYSALLRILSETLPDGALFSSDHMAPEFHLMLMYSLLELDAAEPTAADLLCLLCLLCPPRLMPVRVAPPSAVDCAEQVVTRSCTLSIGAAAPARMPLQALSPPRTPTPLREAKLPLLNLENTMMQNTFEAQNQEMGNSTDKSTGSSSKPSSTESQEKQRRGRRPDPY